MINYFVKGEGGCGAPRQNVYACAELNTSGHLFSPALKGLHSSRCLFKVSHGLRLHVRLHIYSLNCGVFILLCFYLIWPKQQLIELKGKSWICKVLILNLSSTEYVY